MRFVCLFVLTAYTLYVIFFFNYAATTEIYTLSLHDALPIFTSTSTLAATIFSSLRKAPRSRMPRRGSTSSTRHPAARRDRKSTRLNSSHLGISYAVFCLKKKNYRKTMQNMRSHPATEAHPVP